MVKNTDETASSDAFKQKEKLTEEPKEVLDCSPKETLENAFKKPNFIGKARGLKKPVNPQKTNTDNICTTDKRTANTDCISMSDKYSLNPAKEKCVETCSKVLPELPEKEAYSLPYKEPSWSGLPPIESKPYSFEVLKNGCIIETVNLMERSYWVFGRLPNCNISMQHPTISRYHAVLQYRTEGTDTEEPGFYIYDFSSTHGTFLNNKSNKLKPRVYTRVHVGHMLRLGGSQRSFILTGPDEDQEEESEFTITELKQQKEDRIRQAKEEYERRKLEEERRKKKEEERGVDWGMGEDASDDDEENLAENPFAQTTNEELYLDDPKKALRGFFEREGYDLEYDCSEQGMGQFLCKVELPLDDDLGRPIVVEVLHKGKKKEAVVQCALEACRALDRYGVLRQAMHESKKRKGKNWEENDYYDSDDDTFLDRTGVIEKKREKRMSLKQPKKAETYESLVEKEKILSCNMSDLEKQIQDAKAKSDKLLNQTEDDSLDSFMKSLNEPQLDKQKLSKIRLELTQLKKEHANIVRLMNIAKPVHLPELKPQTTQQVLKSKTPYFIVGKRSKIKLQLPKKPKDENLASSSFAEEEEVEEDSDSESKKIDTECIKNVSDVIDKSKDDSKRYQGFEDEEVDINTESKEADSKANNEPAKEEADTLKNFVENVSSKSIKHLSQTVDDVKEEKSKSYDSDHEGISSNPDSLYETLKRSAKPSNKRRKKEDEKVKGYEGEKLGDDYSMWVPPSDQSGDGRTSLNDKLGY